MKRSALVFGDILAILLITLIGFATHGELNTSFTARMSAVFFPLVIAWFLLAPWFGLFQQEITSNPKQLWRPALAMIFTAPLAALLRAIILNSAVLPIFAIILGGTSVLGIIIWRAIYFLSIRNSR